MWLSKANYKKIVTAGHVLIEKKTDFKLMITLHSLWFLMLLFEKSKFSFSNNKALIALLFTLLLISQLVRRHSQNLLKEKWLIYPATIQNHLPIKTGLYRYIRHPNYLVAMLEIILLPVLGGKVYTLFIVSPFLIWHLIKRCNMENNLLYQTKTVLLFFLLINLPILNLNNIYGATLNEKYSFETYELASKAKQKLWFIGESKKLGIIKTTFTGYAQKFELSYQLENEQISDAKILIPAETLSTDSSKRDEKMQNLCLESKKYPQIVAIITDKIALPTKDKNDSSQNLNITFEIRGIKKSYPLSIELKRTADHISIEGNSTFKLSDFSIPDPSIVVASVNDLFQVYFSLEIKAP